MPCDHLIVFTGVFGSIALLQQRQQQAQEVRRINEARFDPQGLRDSLLARKAQS
ncbi:MULTISPECIES: hypothetical protein [unclassified Coleofasciculus]|uniref:hypothetical protein n=1 Tax=unclassified Coleofasciculus TaxID=2692782 RepID=UPI001881D645|nr:MULTISPECIES: hypothetical protein [unclassified Coleofasciculus]MBE9128534.1 hypothetical protein [Coleofasciculus sp. LEGE 07081]MBE9152492.1 hypothetical protein [Coleofasciculus sp. LEGE 07092]